tara:strand:+ start:19654 stop:19764 length:111 start_codon:yes stop_codon:yes gene_type:complete
MMTTFAVDTIIVGICVDGLAPIVADLSLREFSASAY